MINLALYSVTKLLEMLDSARKSKLVVRPPLTSWLDNDGRIALMGDACHSMLVSIDTVSV